MTKGHPLEKYLAELPPIAGFETAVRDVSSNEVQQKDIRILTLEFADLKVKHLRELWIDRMRYTGDADVTGGMLYERAMDLSGSTLSLEGATLKAGKRSWPHLWLRAVADPCLLTPNGKLMWSARLALGASNLAPLLAIVSANAPLPAGLGLFADSANVKVEASLMVREDSVELPRVVLTSQNVRLEGALVLREVSQEDPRLEPWGSVLAHAGVFSAGVEFDGPRVSVVLGDLQRWSERRKLTPTSGLER